MTTLTNSKKFMKDIRTIYQSAMAAGKWYTALQAIVLQAKLLGYYQRRQIPKIQRIADMNEGELLEFMHMLVQHDPDLATLETPEEKEERERRCAEIYASKQKASHPPPEKASV